MATDSCNWQDHKDIERWIAKWPEAIQNEGLSFVGEFDPLDELRKRLARGDFAGKNRASVEAYVAGAEEKAHRVSDDGKAEREERAIAAAERSASSADRSANSAEESTKWARLAVLVALAALAVSAWPYLKDWLG